MCVTREELPWTGKALAVPGPGTRESKLCGPPGTPGLPAALGANAPKGGAPGTSHFESWKAPASYDLSRFQSPPVWRGLGDVIRSAVTALWGRERVTTSCREPALPVWDPETGAECEREASVRKTWKDDLPGATSLPGTEAPAKCPFLSLVEPGSGNEKVRGLKRHPRPPTRREN